MASDEEPLTLRPTPSEVDRIGFQQRAQAYGVHIWNSWPEFLGDVEGDTVFDPTEDMARQREIVERQRQLWRNTKRKEERRDRQVIPFLCAFGCIVFFGDQHLGNEGTNIDRALSEAKLVSGMPNTMIGLLGELVDNFTIGRLKTVGLHARTTPEDEWYLVREYLEIVAPRVVLAIPGNHANWFQILTGVPFFQHVTAAFSPRALYGKHSIRATVTANGRSWRLKCRHKWRYNSQYSPTHSIEKAVKWGKDFDVGVGAHIHQGAFARDMTVDGSPGLAVMVGPYKEYDEHADDMGYYEGNGKTGVAVFFNGHTGQVSGTNDLEFAKWVMERNAAEEVGIVVN